MRLHLDLLGGLAGDMFTACLLDAFPQHETGTLASVAVALRGRGVVCRRVPHDDGVLSGQRFEVSASGHMADAPAVPEGHARRHEHEHEHRQDHAHAHDHELEHERRQEHEHLHEHEHLPGGPPAAGRDAHRHGHTPWREIRASLEGCGLAPAVLRHALGIFGLLAEAEATVHGRPVDEVVFHEVGAWDSIADIVAAAHLIDALGAARWTVGGIPLGSGRVRTAHGPMPVPAPATALLLEGFELLDDGIAGERVTPTGAAILRHLCDGSHTPADRGTAAKLLVSGIGFGTRRLPGISNCVRVMAFDAPAAAPAVAGHRQLAVIEFEVDDQSAEDLATGLDHLRAHPAIFDVVQMPVFGKKGRMMTSVRALAAAASLDAAIEACFRETTTIGLRHRMVDGAALPRSRHEVPLDGATLRVKAVERPGGATAKTESDDVAAQPGHAARQAMRARAEAVALQSLREAGAGAPAPAGGPT